MRLNSTKRARVARAEAMPASQNHRLPEVMPNSITEAMAPKAVPALTPSSSGPAIGFLVTRCRMTPVMASMVPVAAARRMRG